MDYMEFKGKTKGEAITEACRHFSIPSDKLDYKVIDEGKAGFLGMGAKPALIRARVKDEDNEVIEPVKISETPAIAGVNYKNSNVNSNTNLNTNSHANSHANSHVSPQVKETAVNNADVNIDVESVSKKFLEDVFGAMNISVEISTKYDDSLKALDVELSGDEMGVLIGKRGQTLDSLQYLISLVVNKGMEDYIKVKVDTENYRQRRRDTLENLAKNISYKVKRTRRSVSLEPMNPYERRIIHSALQNDRFVTTHSEGDEPFRRVVVVPKRENNYNDNRSGYRSNNRGNYSHDRNRNYSRGYGRDNRAYGNDRRKNYSKDGAGDNLGTNEQQG